MKKPKKNKEPINSTLTVNEDYIKDRLGLNDNANFDVGIRNITLLSRPVAIYYCNSLADASIVTDLMRELMRLTTLHDPKTDVKKVIKNHLTHYQISELESMDEVVDKMLSGLIVIMIDGEPAGISIDTRHYPGRQPEEPDTEKVVRGARDGFTENIIENAGLIRRRVRDERYRHEILQIGERSKTDVCICYIKDVANPGLLRALKKEMDKIEVDGIPMADKALEEFIIHQGMNPYPLVRYTERPDVAAAHILEGHILIITDTSPSIMIFPTTFFHHVQHAEEYRQTPSVGAFLRWVRFAAMLMSIFLVPLWLVLVMHHEELLPHSMAFLGPNKASYHVPLPLQVIIAEIGIEIIRMAAIHTPSSLSTALGLIAAVLIGQIAVKVGVFVPEVILYTSVAAIGAFATPSYELSVANKIARICLIIASAAFGVPGFMIFTTFLIIYLARVKNLNTPYLWPFIPFNPKGMFNILIRASSPLADIRPSIVRPQNVTKQPSKSQS